MAHISEMLLNENNNNNNNNNENELLLLLKICNESEMLFSEQTVKNIVVYVKQCKKQQQG